MSVSHPRDPLHGITLETIIKELVERYGWAEMGRRVPIRCFLHDPSVKSSLTFLRKTPWARNGSKGGTSRIKTCEQSLPALSNESFWNQGTTNSMASNATIFKATIQIADMDRQYYQDHVAHSGAPSV